MPDDASVVETIRANAELVAAVVRKKLGSEDAYGEPAVRWLDGFIGRQWSHGDPEPIGGLIQTLGSFLGECVIHTHGGRWTQDGERWAVRFDDNNAVYPFTKVEKHLSNGPEDSVLSFFTLIPGVFKDSVNEAHPRVDPPRQGVRLGPLILGIALLAGATLWLVRGARVHYQPAGTGQPPARMRLVDEGPNPIPLAAGAAGLLLIVWGLWRRRAPEVRA